MDAIKYQEYYTYKDYKNFKGEWEIINGFSYAISPKPIIKHQNIFLNIKNMETI